MANVLLRTTIATLIALTGGMLGIWLSKTVKTWINILVYAAMGILLAVTLFDILPDAKELLNWPIFLAATASGYGVFWLLGKYVYHVCPSCSISAFDETTTKRLGQSVVLLMIALGVHCTMDGIAVVVGDDIAGHPNLGVMFGVSFHKLPEGLALGLLLLGAGYSRKSAMLWVLAIEMTTELGGLLGVLALQHASLFWLGVVFAHAGGGFVYLITNTATVLFNRPPGQPLRKFAMPIALSGGLAFTTTAGVFAAIRFFLR